MNETLAVRASRWKAAMADGATGPLRIASEVVALSEDWERYRAEADGLDCTTWIGRIVPPNNLARFKQLHGAVTALGDYSKRALHYRAAVYVARGVPSANLEAVKVALLGKYRENRHNPVTLKQAVRVVSDILERKPQRRACARCARLEAILAEHGIAMPE